MPTSSLMVKADFLTTSWVLEQFSDKTQAYINFVGSDSDKHLLLSGSLKTSVLGSPRFKEEAQEKIKTNRENTRIQ